MMRLHINIDHVATIRQARRTDEPDPVRVAVLAELGGADGITVHLREDRRHIQDRDVRLLLETVRTGVNLELAAAPDVLAIAEELRPMAATLVPEHREEVTTEGGLSLDGPEQRERVRDAVARMRDAGVRTSLFIDPDAAAIDAAAELGVDAVELHTGEYANARLRGQPPNSAVTRQLQRLKRAAAHARAAGVAVHAGHGLTYENVANVAAIAELEELNIGHSVVSRAMFVGMRRAVREMKRIVNTSRRDRTGAER
jgi:pyridoxine 5-phosphate synthase